jgi:toxin FitB
VSFILDTCVVFELVKPKPAASVASWVSARAEETLFLSVLTIGELHEGIARLPASAKRDALAAWVDGSLRQRFRDRILPIDEVAAVAWGRIVAEAESRGQPVSCIDSLIAATAIAHGYAVVTRNVEHLAACGAVVVDPWQAG